VLEVLCHRAKYGEHRVSPTAGAGVLPTAGAAKNVEIFTGSIARSATSRYLIYSDADFAAFRPARATRCTDKGEIRHVAVERRSAPPRQISPPSVQR